MRSGPLRHRVIIQSRTATAGGDGSTEFAWGDVGEAWANIQPVKAEEREFYHRQEGICTHIVTMRYTPDLTSQCRLLFQKRTRTLNIYGVVNVNERNRELRVEAIEVTG